jgi:hypothetical protein
MNLLEVKLTVYCLWIKKMFDCTHKNTHCNLEDFKSFSKRVFHKPKFPFHLKVKRKEKQFFVEKRKPVC